MNKQLLILSFFCWLPVLGWGQANTYALIPSQQITVTQKEDTQLSQAWAGGLNAVYFQSMDLNEDGMEDLVGFDKSAGRLSIFIKKENTFQYSPEYTTLFPEFLYWFALVDYNCDGHKDLFTGDNNTVYLYPNTSSENLSLFGERIKLETTNSLGNPTSLRIPITDIPSFTDIDGDGDIDVFTYDSNGNIQWHKNFSMEENNDCQQILLALEDRQWGNIRECGDCATFLFSEEETCEGNSNLRPAHAGGSLLLADLNQNGVRDLVSSEVECTTLFPFLNEGTTEMPQFSMLNEEVFSENSNKVDLVFPSLSAIKLDNKITLLGSSNLFVDDLYAIDFSHSSYQYELSENNTYTLKSTSFLQEEMIDIGAFSTLSTADIDKDGDTDLLIGQRGQSERAAQLFLFENIGTDIAPEFTLQSENYLNLSSLELYDLTPQWADLDQDGLLDLLFLGRDTPFSSQTQVYYLPQTSEGWNLDNLQTLDIRLFPQSTLNLQDINGDQLLDILSGDFNGTLHTYINQGNLSFEKQSTPFLGINDFQNRYPSILLLDFNEDGKEDLLLGGNDGKLKIAYDYKNQETPIFQEELMYNPQSAQLYPSRLGRHLSLAPLGNFILSGSAAGGILLFEKGLFEVTATIEEKQPTTPITLYPNPAQEYLKIANQATTPATIRMIQADGRHKATWQVPANQTKTFDISSWGKGGYFCMVEVGGEVYRQKIIIK
ncbi:T9SS type A sorting domain-containing protein [Algivirga pacifica]